MMRVLLLLLSLLIVAPERAMAQSSAESGADVRQVFYDEDGLFSDEQMRTLLRDADLLQRTDVPTAVHVRQVPAGEAAPERAQVAADERWQAWNSAKGSAQDGLVLLVSWVPDNPAASTVVFSYGDVTFDGSGLSPASIQETIDTSVRSLFEQHHLFEATVYLMRETRYDGVYSPPPPEPLTGGAMGLHNALSVIGPMMAVVVGFGLALLSVHGPSKTFRAQHHGIIFGVTIALATLLWRLSVYGESRTGVVSSFIIIALLIGAAWAWTRPALAIDEDTGPRIVRVRGTQIRRRSAVRARATLHVSGGAR